MRSLIRHRFERVFVPKANLGTFIHKEITVIHVHLFFRLKFSNEFFYDKK